MSAANPAAFSGDIPAKYDRGLGPVLMEPFAIDLAARISAKPGDKVLELAAGTGVLTGKLAERLGNEVAIAATDLNQGMLDVLNARMTGRNVAAEVVDACALPYEEGSFSWIVSQFGVMFFPDKAIAFAEARRVLRPGGAYLFNVWDSLEHNDFARCINDMLKEKFSSNPPKFYETPFGFSDTDAMTGLLSAAGFADIKFERVAKDCTGASVAAFCEGIVEGNPVVAELELLGDSAVEDCKAEFCRRFKALYGDGPFKAKMQAIVYEATKS